MKFTSKTSTGVAAMAALMLAAPVATSAQQADEAGAPEIPVYGSAPADLSGFEDGPDIEGFISAQDAEKIQITLADGSGRNVYVSTATEIRSSGGFLGLSRKTLGRDDLLNGLPVEIETVQWGRGLVASEIELKNKDFRTASMIRNGTSQQFAQQGAAISANAAAAEALRGRMGDIDKYNIKGTTNVFFDTGKWNLSPNAQAELCDAAAEAEAMENALLLVVGYTDSVGSQDLNQELSEKRAGRVVNYLQQSCGWKPWRMLTPTGFAEADPMADNSTAAGRAQNRRVGVNILVSKSVEGI